MNDFRDDDVNVGYCPECGAPLTSISMGGLGFCEVHGWRHADWKRVPPDEESWPYMIFDLESGNALDAAETKEEAEAKAEKIRKLNPEMDPETIGVIGPPE